METVIYSFKGGSDAASPYAGLIADNQGALYGTTEFGVGSGCQGAGCETVFKLTPPANGQTAWTETVLYTFCSLPNCSDGAHPVAGLIADEQGALYGTTFSGGTAGFGTVFKLTPPAKGQTAWMETVLYSFKDGSEDGSGPTAGLIADKEGALYGTTGGGGNGCLQLGDICNGTVFKLTPPAKGQTAWMETVLYSFKGSFNGGTDGSEPRAGLIADNHGAIYGTTTWGGGGNGGGCAGTFNQVPIGCGTVFKLTPPGKGQASWIETVLYKFQGSSDGAYPAASLILDNRGALYGTTYVGGGSGCQQKQTGSCGTVFKLTPPAKGQTVWTETVLHSFTDNGSDGLRPLAGLIADEQSALYA